MALVETTVTEVMERVVDQWYVITIEGIPYFVTPEHPFFTNTGLVAAEDLRVGDVVLHSSLKDKLSFRMKLVNPMKNKKTAMQKASNTDYSTVGNKIRSTIKHKQSLGIYTSSWNLLTDVQKDTLRKKIAYTKIGSKNPMYKGNNDNFTSLKRMVLDKDITECSLCESTTHLEVHHIDGDTDNDKLENLSVLCKSCHTVAHKKGYNFWNKNRASLSSTSQGKMKERLVATGRNGMVVEKIEFIDTAITHEDPLKVYNISCAPYNSYLLDYMWVHNCDTTYSFGKGHKACVSDILTTVRALRPKKVTLTGGEPMIQKDVFELIKQLLEHKYTISIETNGTVAKHLDHPDISWVFDYKLPSSEMESFMLLDNFKNLNAKDWVKFVIADELDFGRAITVRKEMDAIGCKAKYAYSPVPGYSVDTLVNNLLKHGEGDEVVSMQIHKIVWPTCGAVEEH